MICVECQTEMTGGMKGMGVIVKFVRQDGTVYFRRGDEIECPTCGRKVVSSFGEAYEDKADKVAKYTVQVRPSFIAPMRRGK